MLDSCTQHSNCIVVFTYPTIDRCPFCVDIERRNIRIQIAQDNATASWAALDHYKAEARKKSRAGKALRKVEAKYAKRRANDKA